MAENKDTNDKSSASKFGAKKGTDAKKSGDLSNYVFGKIQPQALPLEEAVLGALMLDREGLAIVMDTLRSESFYLDSHKLIYTAILRLFERSDPVDLLTVTEELRKNGNLEKIGGAYYLVELTNRVASAANIEYHARIIAEKHIQRSLISVSTKVIQDAYEDTTDVFQLLDDAEKGLFAITQNNLSRSFESMGALSSRVLKQVEELSKKQDGLTGVPTGFSNLDRLTSGWQPSDFIIVAARPGMGKCLGKGTKIVMFDGTLKKVEDIEVDDLLMGDDSTPRKVLSLARGRERMYWVRQNKGVDYRVNESHILSLKRSRNEGSHQQGTVLNINVKEYAEQSKKFQSNYKGYRVAVEFDEKPLKLPPYFIGLWLGDGSASNSGITTQDVEIIDYLGNYAKTLDLDLKTSKQANRCTTYKISGGYTGNKGYSLQAVLNEIGVLNNKHIPQVYLTNSTENRLQLLAGLLDSDGHYLVQSNSYEIVQKRKELAEQIKFLCDSLGFRTSLTAKKARIASIGYETEVYRLRIYGDIDRIPVCVQRKRALPWNSPVDWKVTGIQVEYDKVDDYYGFEIDGNHLFLLEDMTVTHNTSFVLAMALNAARDFGKGVALFSLEMANTQLVQRLIAMESEIPAQKLRNGKMEDYEWKQLHATVEKLESVPIFIDDTPGINIFELRAKCRRLKMQHDIQIVIIDYLQLMTGGSDSAKGGNREQEISSISRALKGMAKELGVPVIALSQLSRAVETRGGTKRPQLSDLRECVTGDTRIALADGSFRKISDCVGEQLEVLTLDRNTLKITSELADLIWEVGVKPVFELKLASGRTIKATAEHRLLGIDGWVMLNNLEVGSRLALPRTLPNPKETVQALSDDEIVLLGHLIGDGSYLKGQPLRYTTASKHNSEAVKTAAERSFGVTVNRHKSPNEGKWHQLVFSGNGNRWSPAGMNKWLRDLGIFNQRSFEKHLPNIVFQQSNEKIALLLQHLWATDGTMFVPKGDNVNTSTRIAFSTNSRQLSDDVAHLLLRIGIVARIREVPQGKDYKTMYSTEVSGIENQLLFLETVGAFGEKAIQADNLKNYIKSKKPNTNVDTIPIEIYKTVKSEMQNQSISQREMAKMRGTSYGGTSHFKYAPSRQVLGSYAELLENPSLQKLASSDIYWDTIKEITYIGEETVYDLTVPENACWIANGIFSHNSGAIEQDADIVSFIYRPEYYQILEDEQGQSLKGIAEIIVAKHRNGALDTVQLKWIGELAKFDNLDDQTFSNSPLSGPFTPSVITRPSKLNDDIPF